MGKTLEIDQLRTMYLRFFEQRGHAIIPGASLLPDGDPSVLFTTAGMHPLVPYLRGQPHAAGRRLANVQKCIRTSDIDLVGDRTHLTFFEMLGNWSLDDYGKEQSIRWSHELLTSLEWLAIPDERLWVSVFAGDGELPRDEQAARTWLELGVAPERIVYLGMEDNFWAAGTEGPCGPDTEIFYDTTGEPCGAPRCAPGLCNCRRFVEIWNNVFMSYERSAGALHELRRHNIDTGMGLERVAAVLCDAGSVYEVQGLRAIAEHLLSDLGKRHDELSERELRALRICIDHLRTAVFILGDPNGPEPANTGAGYVLRRLIRRAVRYCRILALEPSAWEAGASVVVEHYASAYPELQLRRARILESLREERERFERTLDRGSRLLAQLLERNAGTERLSGAEAFRLYDTYGFPLELTVEMAGEHGVEVDVTAFERCFAEHRERSRSIAAKSGLADDSRQSVRYHTATHLLHAALRAVLGAHVEQRGSNISADRLRFDFSHGGALTSEERSAVEAWVQQAIDRDLPVYREVSTSEAAKARGATGLFDDRYDGEVSVYGIGDLSLEICAGPHVERTSELGRFRIVKEQSCGAGMRRIRALLSPT
ncbi:MAG: alanine--tRNA ligase [Myxococcales bacterium]|nr:alanine--tRNA ligase [Myxococcales bacterium]